MSPVPDSPDQTVRVDAPVWLSTKDAAEILGVAVRTLYRFIDEGELPAYKLGRVIRLQRTDVEAFIESKRLVPGSLQGLYSTSSEQPET
jgi:excisionase family DNA binding protein